MGSIQLSDVSISNRARALMQDSVVWDSHMCMPLKAHDVSFLPQLERVKNAGLDVVSINVSCDSCPSDHASLVLGTMRHWIKSRPDQYVLVEGVADIERAKAEDKLAVTFDIEGGLVLEDHLPMIQFYYDLGVRWMLFAYNLNNSLGGGCQDDNMGLADLGREVVREMERVGMLVCCSHISHQTAMDILEMAENPVIFSHSNPRALKDHYRNIKDEAIVACAGTGGVVSINGIGDFLGNNDISTEAILRHIDYVAQLVGPQHVGIGTDYCFDQEDVAQILKDNPETFNPEDYSDGIKFMEPERFPAIAEGLLAMNYSETEVRGILGENHLRVAKQVWK